MKPDRRKAQAGECFFVANEVFARHLVPGGKPGLVEVMPKSKGDPTKGQWICLSCCMPLENNSQKDAHCAERAPRKSALVGSDALPQAKHVLAWRSLESGKVEEP